MFVYIEQTDLRQYSQDLDADSLPESRAIKQIRQSVLARTGLDLFTSTIKPGDRVVIKPNFVRDSHPDNLDLFALITHPAIIRAVIDEVYEALRGEGEIIIADAPIGDADFDRLVAVTGIQCIVEYYRRVKRFEIAVRDLRKYRYTLKQGPHGYAHEVRLDLAGDPAGYLEVDLGSASAFANLERCDLLQGTDVARRAETISYHTPQPNKYLIARTVLDADVLISIPKLKTHGKVGVTLNAKNMVASTAIKITSRTIAGAVSLRVAINIQRAQCAQPMSAGCAWAVPQRTLPAVAPRRIVAATEATTKHLIWRRISTPRRR